MYHLTHNYYYFFSIFCDGDDTRLNLSPCFNVRDDHHASLIDAISSIMVDILNAGASQRFMEVILQLQNLIKGRKVRPLHLCSYINIYDFLYIISKCVLKI